jgi:hypothetical protein
MSDFDILEARFRVHLGQFLLSIQTVRIVDVEAFQEIDRESEELALALKGHPLVPKSLLNELRTATKVLRAEAPYVEGKKNLLIKMADRLEMTFDLILIDECYGDRVPGVPRII